VATDSSLIYLFPRKTER